LGCTPLLNRLHPPPRKVGGVSREQNFPKARLRALLFLPYGSLDMTLPTLRDLHLARKRTSGLLRRTPLVESDSLSALTAAPVFLKLESLQTTGAFKLRGATNRLLMLSPEERERGVVTVSTGNHGRALAFAARRLGMRAVVCLSQLVPENKRAAIRKLGAELRIVGHSQDEAAREAERLI